MKFHLLEVVLALGLMGEADTKTLDPNEVVCMAQNIYHEARGETLEGQRAVAHVTLNRLHSAAYPDTICEVVYQPDQFSWTRRAQAEPSEPAAYETAVVIALGAITGLSKDPTHGATHYFDHTTVTPGWSRAFRTTRVIGGHTFKREM
jgi:spore germination cell wall hydrolase CwlJ-like protein